MCNKILRIENASDNREWLVFELLSAFYWASEKRLLQKEKQSIHRSALQKTMKAHSLRNWKRVNCWQCLCLHLFRFTLTWVNFWQCFFSFSRAAEESFQLAAQLSKTHLSPTLACIQPSHDQSVRQKHCQHDKLPTGIRKQCDTRTAWAQSVW